MSGCTSSALFWSGVPVKHQRCRADSAMHALKLSECLFFHNTHAQRMCMRSRMRKRWRSISQAGENHK
jgi:hypothetical protein